MDYLLLVAWKNKSLPNLTENSAKSTLLYLRNRISLLNEEWKLIRVVHVNSVIQYQWKFHTFLFTVFRKESRNLRSYQFRGNDYSTEIMWRIFQSGLALKLC